MSMSIYQNWSYPWALNKPCRNMVYQLQSFFNSITGHVCPCYSFATVHCCKSYISFPYGTLILTLSRVWLDSRSVWHSVKCTQNGVTSGMMCSQSSAGHPSLKTVRDNMRIASPALVPFINHGRVQCPIISSSHASWQSSRGKGARGVL